MAVRLNPTIIPKANTIPIVSHPSNLTVERSGSRPCEGINAREVEQAPKRNITATFLWGRLSQETAFNISLHCGGDCGCGEAKVVNERTNLNWTAACVCLRMIASSSHHSSVMHAPVPVGYT